MRMTRRVKPPTAAVTMTSTWPWSDATSDAMGGGGGMRVRMLRTGKGTGKGTGRQGKETFSSKGAPSLQLYTVVWQRLW